MRGLRERGLVLTIGRGHEPFYQKGAVGFGFSGFDRCYYRGPFDREYPVAVLYMGFLDGRFVVMSDLLHGYIWGLATIPCRS